MPGARGQAGSRRHPQGCESPAEIVLFSGAMSPTLVRFLLLLLAALLITAGDEVARIQSGRGAAREAVAVIAFTLGVTAAVAVGLPACLPWNRLTTIARKMVPAAIARQVASGWHDTPGIPWCKAVGSTVALVLILAIRAPRQTDYVGTDQEAYVLTAVEIADGGGPMGLVRDLVTGRFAEANRHPLYLGLLSVHPDYAWGKWLAASFAVAVHLLGVAQTARWYGQRAAAGFAVLNGLNSALINTGVTVACETLVALLVFAGFWAAHGGRGGRDRTVSETAASPSANDPGSTQPGLSLACWLGFWTGLGWLTKGTALILAPAAMLWLMFSCREGDHRRQPGRGILLAGLFASLFALTAAPLLMRNVVRYGSPAHNVNSWLMFVDHYEDPVALSERWRLSELARRYAAETGVEGLVLRELRGLVWESFILLRGLGPVGLGEWRVLPGVLVAALVLLGLLSTPRRDVRSLALGWVIPSLALFAWYVPIAAGERFPAPLIPILLVYAGVGWSVATTRYP